MRSKGRWIGLLIPVLLILIGLLWPVVFTGSSQGSAVADPVVITNMRADFAVDADGLMQATETITAEFPSGRHGIFRFFDVGNPNDAHVRQVPEVAEISLDDRPVPYQLLWQRADRFLVAKIGDPDSYLSSGTHVFRIRYSIAGVLDPGTTGDKKEFAASTGDPSAPSVFFWNVIAPGWNNEIDRAEVSVRLPGPVPGAQCSVGQGLGRACDGLTVEGDTVRLTTAGLAPRTPVTLRAGVDVPTPPRATVAWSLRWDPVLGRSLPLVAWLLGLTAAMGLGAFLWWRTTVEPAPGFPLQYAPPKGLGPVQCEYIRTESVPLHGLTATLFHLADRGLFSLEQKSAKKWTVRSVGEAGAWADVDPVSVAVGSALDLTRPGRTFNANGSVSAGRKLSRAKDDMGTAVKNWAFDGGLMVKRRVELWARLANVVALVLAFTAFTQWLFPITLWGLPFAVFFLFSARSWAGESVRAARPPAASCGPRRADSTACWRPTRRSPGSTSRPVKTSTPPTSRSRWPVVPPRCGRPNTRQQPASRRPNRTGTTPHRAAAGVRCPRGC